MVPQVRLLCLPIGTLRGVKVWVSAPHLLVVDPLFLLPSRQRQLGRHVSNAQNTWIRVRPPSTMTAGTRHCRE